MSDTYVLVHGAWHTGAEMEPTATHLRAAGHTVHCPTLAGNRPGDDRASTGLEEAARSLTAYLEQHALNKVRLVGHSYGGMVISRVADLAADRIARLVYVNAFVPQPGECLNDLVPPHYTALFDAIAAQTGGAVMLPFPVWREAFINDADLALATQAFERLNPHPYKTFQDPITLSQPMAASLLPKSYVNCRMDCALPQSLGWHPRLSERLGLFRYIECSGSHEVWFTDPSAIAAAIEQAGRD
ncbi:MAG: alpha/beta fold hydrolase [Burkholderiales bacterium]|nr:alpha/beta fold hydrolase [Burkholderiales bacterium]